MDFSAGPPDVSGLDRVKRLEVMREYRRWKETPRSIDFSAGPPDVSGMDKGASLEMLRAYRQWLQENAQPSPVKSSPAPQSYRAPLPTDIDVETVELPAEPAPESAAGLVSGVVPSQYNYFERPVSARENRVSAVSEAWMEPASPTPPPPPVPKLPVPPSPGADDAAGLSSRARQGAFGWLEEEEPRRFRTVWPSERGATENRVFADKAANTVLADEERAEEIRKRKEIMLMERQRESEQRIEALAANMNESSIAGIATPLSPDHMAQSVHPGKALPKQAPTKPITVGMTKQEEEATIQSWRAQVHPGVAPPVNNTWHGQAAGIVHHRATMRAQVATPDYQSTADYNLQVKQARDVGVDLRQMPPAAPWLGGSERHQPSQPLSVPPSPRVAAPWEGGAASVLPPAAPPTPRADLSGLSHAEKLAKMRALRHAQGA